MTLTNADRNAAVKMHKAEATKKLIKQTAVFKSLSRKGVYGYSISNSGSVEQPYRLDRTPYNPKLASWHDQGEAGAGVFNGAGW
jgi:hypothetical protein